MPKPKLFRPPLAQELEQILTDVSSKPTTHPNKKPRPAFRQTGARILGTCPERPGTPNRGRQSREGRFSDLQPLFVMTGLAIINFHQQLPSGPSPKWWSLEQFEREIGRHVGLAQNRRSCLLQDRALGQVCRFFGHVCIFDTAHS